MRMSGHKPTGRRVFQIPVITVRPSGTPGPARSRLGLGALPILQFKELEVDYERYHAWKASLKRPSPRPPSSGE
jgi:hypothetical protein